VRDAERANDDEAGVEKEGVHEGAAHAHGMDGEEEEHAHAKFEVALDATHEKIE